MSYRPPGRMEMGNPEFSQNLREDLANIQKDSEPDKQARKRELFDGVEKKLIEEQEQITETINNLYEFVAKHPAATGPELIMEVGKMSQGNPFSKEVEKNFISAIAAYEHKHSEVNTFFNETNGDPKVMFKKCFGAEPKGKIEVIRGAMILSFRCYEDGDYIAAFTHAIPVTDIKEKELKTREAKMSGGVAFSQVKISKLAGCIAAERVGNNFRTEKTIGKVGVDRSENGSNRVSIKYPSAAEGSVVSMGLPESLPVEIVLERTESGELKSAAVSRMEGKVRVQMGTFSESQLRQTVKLNIPIPGANSGTKAELLLSGDSATIARIGQGTAEVETKDPLEEKFIKDEARSKKTFYHEEQHQFNKLFVPRVDTGILTDTARQDLRRVNIFMQNELAKASKDGSVVAPERQTQLIAQSVAEILRKNYIDQRARDEILAYTKDGRDTASIFEILATSDLYKYKSEQVLDQAGSPTTRLKYIEHQVEEITKSLLTRGKHALTLEKSATLLEVDFRKKWEASDTNIVHTEVERALSDAYIQKLRRWTGLVEHMKNAGYTNQHIVSYLGMFPINKWHTAVRRLLKSKGQRPIDKEASRTAS